MIKVIPFEPEHVLNMEPLMEDAYTREICKNPELLASLKKLGPAFSGFTPDGTCVGAAGVRSVNAKTYEGWALLAKDSKRYIRSILKAVDIFILSHFELDAIDRFQATVKMDFAKGHRFAKLLHFRPEGILHSYDQGEDYMMYARTNTWL